MGNYSDILDLVENVFDIPVPDQVRKVSDIPDQVGKASDIPVPYQVGKVSEVSDTPD